MTWVAVALAGAAGAVLRYLVDHLATTRLSAGFPFGTIVVNVTGSFLAGVLTGLVAAQILSPALSVVVGGGLLGAYTTFSTAMYEAARLVEQRAATAALASLLGGLFASVGAAALGWWLAGAAT